jgi:hypothetical protein
MATDHRPEPRSARNVVVGHLLSLQRQEVPNHDTGLRVGGTLAVSLVAAEVRVTAGARK